MTRFACYVMIVVATLYILAGAFVTFGVVEGGREPEVWAPIVALLLMIIYLGLDERLPKA